MEHQLAAARRDYALPTVEQVQAWAAAALAQFDQHLHPHAVAIAELRAAHVPQVRIDALYPYAPHLYNVGLATLLSDLEVLREQAQAWQRVRVHGEIALDLPAATYETFDAELYCSREDELQPEELVHYGKDLWAADFYLSRLLDALYEYPTLLRALSRPLAADTLAKVEPAAFERLERSADVLALRLAELPEASLLAKPI